MEKKDFFISYNKTDKDWAKWIGGTLEENGYKVYLQAWDIAPGDDFIARMNEFLHYSENYLAVLSSAFWGSEYCRKEFQSAFNAHLKGTIKKFFPVRVEDFTLDLLYETIVYIDLFFINEEKAAERVLLNGIGNTSNPRKKGTFPIRRPIGNGQDSNNENVKRPSFPGPGGSLSNGGSESIKNIIILESDQNKKGDLFNRLVSDVLHSLGFGDGPSNLPKSGREIDMILPHRTENRFALVESKAHLEAVGGSEVNKLVGAIDVERGNYERRGSSVTGYFISRSGFTATALEQERERAQARQSRNEGSELILLGPTEIVRELIKGNMLCSLSSAVSAVVLPRGESLSLCDRADLIACEHGWIWVLYYSSHPKQDATHFALVHADGNQLVERIAKILLEQAKTQKLPFTGLSYISAVSSIGMDKQAAKDAYFRYLENELGEIQFEGMPTDKDVGSIKVNLESIFVPLSFTYASPKPSKKTDGEFERHFKSHSASIQDVLTKTSRAAILAKPGGGKSTLIRRIALAYAYPERRKKVDDRLPERNWFPVYIRCRDLGENATKSISEIIENIASRAEIASHTVAFSSFIEDRLQDGCVLLLIDGLDEISIEKYRICFVNQLRTFVATYPTVHLIVTSRETGFRAVAGTLSGYCQQYSIDNLNEKQIRFLSLKWHQTILGESTQAGQDSDKVCDIIVNDPRIMALAENPLLLTTLLFVKRWVGYLPTKKCRLYEEMIKLLLVTWNAVAHDRLDLDETEPQLAFVAHYMTVQGQQKITRSQLKQCIIQARRALPELLSYTEVPPSKFIDQVEERSSLLIQLGLEENEKGQMEPSYEFSHLSFQEYLTARAIVQSWIPDSENSTLLSIVEQHMFEDQWVEVIPLAAVLSGRLAKPTIEYLIKTCADYAPPKKRYFAQRKEDTAALHLGNCIASEVPMSQELLEQAMTQIVQRMNHLERLQFRTRKPFSRKGTSNIFDTILKSKYGSIYREFIRVNLFENLNPNYISQFSQAWITICEENGSPNFSDIVHFVVESSSRQDQITGALLMTNFLYRYRASRRKPTLTFREKNKLALQNIFATLLLLLQSDDVLSHFSAAWCITWSGYEETDIIPVSLVPDIVDRLIDLWIDKSPFYLLNSMISWALCNICRPSLSIQNHPGMIEEIENNLTTSQNALDKYVSIFLTILTGHMSRERVRKLIAEDTSLPTLHHYRFLSELGYYEKI